MSRFVFLCLFVASVAFSAPADSTAAPRLPYSIQALLTAGPRAKDLSALIEFAEAPGFSCFSVSDRIAVLEAANRCALAAGDFDRAVQIAHQCVPLQTELLLEELHRKSADGYASNRARLTTIPNSLRRRLQTVVRTAIAGRDWSAASVHAFQCLSVFPDAPDARTTALTAAESFLKSTPPDPVRALVCFLRALDTGLDRLPTAPETRWGRRGRAGLSHQCPHCSPNRHGLRHGPQGR